MMKRSLISLVFICTLAIVGCMGSNRYDLKMAPLQYDDGTQGWGAIRYIPKTGEAWHISHQEWVKIIDKEPIPQSLYRIEMVNMGANWGAVRMDVNTGESWYVIDGSWLHVNDPD